MPALSEHHPFEAGSLTDSARAHLLYERYPMYRDGLDWLTGFVALRDPRINRPGAVCPRLAPAIDQNLIRLVALATEGHSVEEATDKGSLLPGLYRQLFQDEHEFRAGALLAFFPALPAEHAAEFIDGGHRQLKRDFVRQGLMLGEFHPASTVASARNPEFLVMRSPVPMYAVRALTVHDVMFLDQPQTPAPERVEYLKHYLAHLDDQLGHSARDRVHAALRAAEQEL